MSVNDWWNRYNYVISLRQKSNKDGDEDFSDCISEGTLFQRMDATVGNGSAYDEDEHRRRRP